jgi:anti-sigma regulatory factor (Ser/Thr protein kinase)
MRTDGLSPSWGRRLEEYSMPGTSHRPPPAGATVRIPRPRSSSPALIHEADFFNGTADMLTRTVPFLYEAVAGGEPALVMLHPERAAAVRAALGADADRITFLDKTAHHQPGSLIQIWQAFLAEHPQPWVRGIDEPLRAGARAAETAEAQFHERLIGDAFSGTGQGLLLRCLYDVDTFGPRELADARATHAVIGGELRNGYAEARVGPDLFTAGLPTPPPRAHREPFAGARSLAWARRQVLVRARLAGLPPERCYDLVMAVNELVTNAISHGGGNGLLSIWQEDGHLVCDIHDLGRRVDGSGRLVPSLTWRYGRGLWLVHSLCDLVQLRSSHAGTTARVHMALH